MIYHTIVRLVIGTNTFGAGLEPRRVLMKVRHYTTAAYTESCRTIIFAATTVGSVGNNSCGLVDTAATILVLVAMLSSLAGTREPFKTKLIFSDFHIDIYLVRPEGLEPPVNGL